MSEPVAVSKPVAVRKPAAQRRAEIMEAAEAEFAANGLAGTRLEAIAARVGVSHPRIVQMPQERQEHIRAVDVVPTVLRLMDIDPVAGTDFDGTAYRLKTRR